MTLYILMWPIISAIILFVIVRAFLKDLKEAKSNNDRMI